MTQLSELYCFAENEGITVDCFKLNKKEALSLMDDLGECYIAIDPFKLKSAQDERLKLVHELGHCCTGSFYSFSAACDVRQKHENRADKWAIKRLISESKLDEAIANGYTEIWSLAEYFDVTEDFMKKVVCWYTYGNLDTELYF
ncbi:MAG TPA: ImmA/IrrE family metallo-endopeptidase [Candidatus Scatovicinus merdipullorum]|jgi:hypothetical protein|nr:ImmA/IrrE family metallo-endopeptidase [Candidatus Scatovicinus merdipullorum]